MPVPVFIVDTDFPSYENGVDYLKAGAKDAVGMAVVGLLKSHFIDLNQQRTHGLTQVGFYEKAAMLTSYENLEDSVLFRVARVGMALRYYGGTVVPKVAKYLTIPALAMLALTYNVPAREIPGLKFVKFGKGPDAPAALMKDKKVFYWLVKTTHHPGDQTVLPPMAQIQSVAMEAARKYYVEGLKKALKA